MRRRYALAQCGLVAATAVAVLVGGPSPALAAVTFAPTPPLPSQYSPAQITSMLEADGSIAPVTAADTAAAAGGSGTTAAGVGLSEGAAGAAGAGVAGALSATAVGVIVAGEVYGLDQEWDYYHPSLSGAAGNTPGTGTSYGGGNWESCDGSTSADGCLYDYNGYDVTAVIQAAVTNGARSGEVRITEQRQSDTSNGISHEAMPVCYDQYGSTVIEQGILPANSGSTTWSYDVSSYAACAANGAEGVMVGTVDGSDNYAGRMFWYRFGGSTSFPSGPTSGTATFDALCSDGSIVSTSVSYGTGSPAAVPISFPACPSGAFPKSLTVSDPNVTGGTAIQWNAPAQWTNPSGASFPACLPGGQDSPCVMRLVQQTVTGTQTCGDQVDCTAYTTQASGSTAVSVVEGSDTYECLWGPYAVNLTACDALGPAAEGTSAAPTSTTEPTGTPQLGVPPVDDSGDCFPHGWGLINPVSWVYQPVLCAFRAAVDPSPSTMAELNAEVQDVQTRAPVSYLVDAGTWAGTILGSGSSGTCSLGWDVDLGPLGHVEVLSCSDPIVEILRTYRPLLEVAVMAGFIGPLAWWAWKAYAPGSNTG